MKKEPFYRRSPVLRPMWELADRERKYLMAEVVQVKDLMPLMMKKRNKQPWSNEDRAELRSRLTRLSKVSPYLVVFAMPGGMIMLPALAWWLDRRRRAGAGRPGGGAGTGPRGSQGASAS